MKNKICFLTIMVLVIISCEKDNTRGERTFPFIITRDVIVHEESVSVQAEIIGEGKEEIYYHGFVWSENEYPSINDRHVIFDSEPEEALYDFTITGGLEKGKSYFVRAYLKTETNHIYSNILEFISEGSKPPVILDFEPVTGSAGDMVYIRAVNFAMGEQVDRVYFGDNKARIDSLCSEGIYVRVPDVTKPENVNIKLETTSGTAFSDNKFSVKYPWRKIDDFYMNDIDIEYWFSNDGKAYGKQGAGMAMYQYDPGSNLMSRMADFPGYFTSVHGHFTLAGKTCIISVEQLYADPDINLWQYDPELDEWTKKADYPGANSNNMSTFSLNGKGYIIVNVSDGQSYFNHVWQYDPVTNAWSLKSSVPQSRYYHYTTGFESGDGGYYSAGTGGPDIYQYNDLNDTWIRKSSYPGNGYLWLIAFSISENTYLGLGHDSRFDFVPDLWTWDIDRDNWIKRSSYPFDIRPVFAFVNNDKAYFICSPGIEGESTNFLFEYDPAG